MTDIEIKRQIEASLNLPLIEGEVVSTPKPRSRLVHVNREEKKVEPSEAAKFNEYDAPDTKTSLKKTFRRHVFTCYDMTWDFSKIDWELCSYCTINLEVCPETKRLHYQGYTEFKNAIRHTQVHKVLGTTGGWASPSNGTQEQAIHYCRKPVVDCKCKHCNKARSEGAVANWIEHGKLTTQGKRSDLDLVAEALRGGASLREIASDHTSTMIKYHKGISVTKELLEEEVQPILPEIQLRDWQEDVMSLIAKGFKKRQIIWIWSNTSGTGKSTFGDYLVAKLGPDNVLPGVWEKHHMLHAYKKQKVILFNLPRGHEMHATNFSVLESMSDGGYQTSTKYDSKPKLVYATIIVTANRPPPLVELPKRCVTFNLDANPVSIHIDRGKAWMNSQQSTLGPLRLIPN